MPPSHPAILTFQRDDKVASWFNKTLLRDVLLILREWFNSWICPNRWHATCRIPDNVSRKVFPSVIWCPRPKQELNKFPSEHPTVPQTCLSFLSYQFLNKYVALRWRVVPDTNNIIHLYEDDKLKFAENTFIGCQRWLFQLSLLELWDVALNVLCSHILCFFRLDIACKLFILVRPMCQASLYRDELSWLSIKKSILKEASLGKVVRCPRYLINQ